MRPSPAPVAIGACAYARGMNFLWQVQSARPALVGGVRTSLEGASAGGASFAFGGARGRTDVPRIVDWYMAGKIQIDPLITSRLKLDDINQGFEMMHKGEGIRSVVVY